MYRRYNPRLAKPSKYRAKKVYSDGQVFDSQKEYTEWLKLKLREKAGEITDLERQVRFELIPKQVDPDGKCRERACHYIADFTYSETDTGNYVVVDAKGYRTPEYKIKKKLMLWRFGIAIKEV